MFLYRVFYFIGVIRSNRLSELYYSFIYFHNIHKIELKKYLRYGERLARARALLWCSRGTSQGRVAGEDIGDAAGSDSGSATGGVDSDGSSVDGSAGSTADSGACRGVGAGSAVLVRLVLLWMVLQGPSPVNAITSAAAAGKATNVDGS